MLSSLDVAWFKYLSINKERDRVAISPMIAEMAASILAKLLLQDVTPQNFNFGM